jgi:sugar lactone lactonase YvrE
MTGGDGGTTAGDGGTSDGGAPALVLEVLAGDPEGRGSVDGTGADARFDFPIGVAVDGAGNVYVGDADNSTIRKITPAGIVTTLAGVAGKVSSADGTGGAARFGSTAGVAVDSTGNLYVADGGNSTIRKVTPAGVVTTLAGTAHTQGSADGTGAAARFNFPIGVAVDAAGNLYVADQGNSTIRKVTPAGVVTTLAGSPGMEGSADGTGAAARFNFPTGVAVDGAGNVFVADEFNSAIRKVTPAGVVTTLAGTDGTGAAVQFALPAGVAVDGAGNLYVADQNSTIRRITPAAVVTTLAGTARMEGSTDGIGAAARFNRPAGVAVDSAGDLYVADEFNATIRKVTAASVVTTLAGPEGAAGSDDGSGAAARFLSPNGMTVDGAGNVYVADTLNFTIRKITPTGAVTTLAGAAGVNDHVDDTGAAARFSDPSGVATDRGGNLYVADFNTIRKITPDGAVTTLAGNAGADGSADGTGAAARFRLLSDLALDGAGNLYVADQGNSTIRKITPAGVVTTLAGAAGKTGDADGTGAAARFSDPEAVAVDRAGNVYVADHGTGIRKITPAGVVTTLADTNLLNPTGVVVDGAGNVYVTDPDNATIHRITPTGTITILDVDSALVSPMPGLAGFSRLAIAGDSLVLTYNNAVLVLRHGAR